jgi:hypothetical protein
MASMATATTAAHPFINKLNRVNRELETILTSFDSNYVWNYGSVKEGLVDLYEKAKSNQWNSSTQLAWSTEVDPESEIMPPAMNPLSDYPHFRKLNERERAHLRRAQISLQLSQFLHGEQGALIVASQLVGAVPWIDAKCYAAAPRPWMRPATSRSSAAIFTTSSSGNGRSTQA